MIGTLSGSVEFGEGSGGGNHPVALRLIAHAVGGATGGMALGLLLLGLNWLLTPFTDAVPFGATFVFLMTLGTALSLLRLNRMVSRDQRRLSFGRRWQVPASWMRVGDLAASISWGAALGFGLLTPIYSAAFVVACATLVLLPEFSVAAIVGTSTIFGMLRGMVVVVTLLANDPQVNLRRRTATPQFFAAIFDVILCVGVGAVVLSSTSGTLS